jgi:pyruvate/2-oxoglutarate dehydrogenase complex dihydrolipoamide dehydrogenase (E3) component
MAQPRGFIKAVDDPETGQTLRAALLAVEGGQIMSMLEIGMMAKLPFTALEDGVFAHPSLADGLDILFMSMEK